MPYCLELIHTVFYASLYCIRSCPGVLLAKKRIFKNATPSCVGGGVVEHVSRDNAVWVEVSSASQIANMSAYETS